MLGVRWIRRGMEGAMEVSVGGGEVGGVEFHEG